MVYHHDIISNKITNNTSASNKSLQEFCEATSAHGFSHLRKANGQTEKLIFWHLIICVAFGLLTFHLYTLIDKYLAYDYDETTTLVFESPVFPDITLCNMDAINSARSVIHIHMN